MVRTGLRMKADDILIPFSAETKQGRDEIWAIIDRTVEEG
jgi:GTP-binding protein